MNTVDSGEPIGEGYESLTEAVLVAVADREGTDPAAIEPPLHDVVDPDCLNSLFAPTATGCSRVNGQIEFTYCGYEVTANGDGRVVVEDSANPASPDPSSPDSASVDVSERSSPSGER